jgi:two-component system, OmpR family, sensor kinase
MRSDRHGPPTLYRRLYAYTLGVSLASLLLAFWFSHIGGGWQFAQRFVQVGVRMSGLVADRLAPSLGRPEELTSAVADLSRRLEARLQVFDASGRLLASGGEEMPPPIAADFAEAQAQGSARALGPRRGAHWLLVPIHRDGVVQGYLQSALFQTPERGFPWRLASFFAAVLAVMALLMIPATRSITRPLERLTHSTRRFAVGDFAHRVPVHGRDELGRLATAMNEMAERLSALLHTQQQLLADVSHELRSPLARIQVALELARGGAPTALESIASDVAELSHLVDDCLTASRLDLRPESARPAEVSVWDLLSRARQRALAAGLGPEQLHLEVPSDLPAVRADFELCGHALSNLLDNARRHTPEGTVIVLSARREGGRVRLSVQDHGPGLPAEELPRLFEPFYRPDASRSRESGGAGLGLSLVRRIAELHGDAPQVTSTPGTGSTFSFTVPLV